MGSDETGDGSFENPFATIGHAMLNMENNDWIIVAPGSYEENMSCMVNLEYYRYCRSRFYIYQWYGSTESMMSQLWILDDRMDLHFWMGIQLMVVPYLNVMGCLW